MGNFDSIPFAAGAEVSTPLKLQEESRLSASANDSWRRPSEASSPQMISELGFPSASEILKTTGEKKLTTSNDLSVSPGDAERDDNGRLTRYTIGPDGATSLVKVDYSDSSSAESPVQRVEITRPNNGERIVYDRELSDPDDASAPRVFRETRNGVKGDLQFGSFNVESDGRLSLYFDFAQKRLALTFNPRTGAEEYP